MVQHFPEFLEKRTTSRGIPKFVKISYREFPLHLIFLSEFPEFAIEWFTFRKVNNFRISWKISVEIFVPFVLLSKFLEFLVEWKATLDKLMVGKKKWTDGVFQVEFLSRKRHERLVT